MVQMRKPTDAHFLLIVILLALLAGCQEPGAVIPAATTAPAGEEDSAAQEADTGDATEVAETEAEPARATATATPAPTNTIAPTATAQAQPTRTATEVPETPAATGEADEELLLSDDFRDSGSGWPTALSFDNYYIGYHEPEWYHVEVQTPNEHVPVVLDGETFDDVSVEAEIFLETGLSAEEGDFRHGLVLRRAGRSFYAFAISPRSQRWAVLKSSPSGMETLAEGSNESISSPTETDSLRVEAVGPNFTFFINGEPVAEVEDAAYGSGALGFFVETMDSERVHVHYDSLRVAVPRDDDILLSDDFKDSGSGWPAALTFDNYYIGYHEPDWYHVEVQTEDEYVPVVLEGETFRDVTVEAEIFVETTLSAETGEFRYGLVLRRSGRQYYAFTVDPHSREWAVLKSSATSLETLAQGSDESIRGLEEADILRVDADGSRLLFHVNDRVVAELQDDDYDSGALGFYVQTFDSPRAHIHYDSLSVREVSAPAPACTVIARSLNMRPGPGVAFSPVLRALPEGTQLTPLVRSDYPWWIRVEVTATGERGWVYAAPQYASCNFDLGELARP